MKNNNSLLLKSVCFRSLFLRSRQRRPGRGEMVGPSRSLLKLHTIIFNNFGSSDTKDPRMTTKGGEELKFSILAEKMELSRGSLSKSVVLHLAEFVLVE